MKALDILIGDPRTNNRNTFPVRRGRQLAELSGFTNQETRRERQTTGLDLEGFREDEVCEVTGFESRKREECQVSEIVKEEEDNDMVLQEVKETECKDVEVTKFRMEIKTECMTKHDQSCNVTMKEVPTKECQPSTEEK